MHHKNDLSKTDTGKLNNYNRCGANVRNVRKFTGREGGPMKTFAYEDGTPILRGEMFAPGRVRVWCEHCREFHCHGWPEETPDDSLEHRIAHCAMRPKPYLRGYYIKLEVVA